MTDDPTELRGDLWQDRPVGHLGEVSSSPDLSHAIAKCVSLTAIPAKEAFYRRVSRVSCSRDSNYWWLPAVVTTGRFSRYRETVLMVPAISSISPAGDIVCGCCWCQHPSEGSECRMPESPAGPEAPPGTEGALLPCSFRPGSDRSEVPVRARQPTREVSA